MDELRDIRDPATKAEADQLHSNSIDALRKSRAFMLVTVDEHGTPHVRCTTTSTLSLIETARWAHAIGMSASKVIERLNESVEMSVRRYEDEDAA